MKSNQKHNHCKNFTAMQNPKKGYEKCCKWLRGKDKSINHYKIQCDAQARTDKIPKCVLQKQTQGK